MSEKEEFLPESLRFVYHQRANNETIYDIINVQDFEMLINHTTKEFYITIGDYWSIFRKKDYDVIVALVTKLEQMGYKYK